MGLSFSKVGMELSWVCASLFPQMSRQYLRKWALWLVALLRKETATRRKVTWNWVTMPYTAARVIQNRDLVIECKALLVECRALLLECGALLMGFDFSEVRHWAAMPMPRTAGLGAHRLPHLLRFDPSPWRHITWESGGKSVRVRMMVGWASVRVRVWECGSVKVVVEGGQGRECECESVRMRVWEC